MVVSQESGLKLQDYRYHLPPELIAQEPLPRRDHSRLMILEREGNRITESSFYRFPDFLNPGDLLVLNDTRVIPARLAGRRFNSGGKVEFLLLHREDNYHWQAMVRPGRRLRVGSRVEFGSGLEAVVLKDTGGGRRRVEFNQPVENLLPQIGKVPLPPYIKKDIGDPDLYQTIYASRQGSAAAPTAGFHFTPAIFKALAERQVNHTFITLHIGPGTFQPVKTEQICRHIMHREYFDISVQTAEKINQVKNNGGKVVAVGTTSCRVLETVARCDSRVESRAGWTDLFIYPGYRFKAVDALLTNFHLPCSTLLMLVSAYGGLGFIQEAYRVAVDKRYRFYSFGDCMLVL
ncbi:MAG: tRNA preQ1(34) S-adenosylmethionine ribosyltransferase-isomerase QueA [Firmicutes bacterium]|nr:tRNA preQ1(34) S-adenosylmethionine ribosyltransferase-isomerase QueA [Bacillota bacterium]